MRRYTISLIGRYQLKLQDTIKFYSPNFSYTIDKSINLCNLPGGNTCPCKGQRHYLLSFQLNFGCWLVQRQKTCSAKNQVVHVLGFVHTFLLFCFYHYVKNIFQKNLSLRTLQKQATNHYWIWPAGCGLLSCTSWVDFLLTMMF